MPAKLTKPLGEECARREEGERRTRGRAGTLTVRRERETGSEGRAVV